MSTTYVFGWKHRFSATVAILVLFSQLRFLDDFEISIQFYECHVFTFNLDWFVSDDFCFDFHHFPREYN